MLKFSESPESVVTPTVTPPQEIVRPAETAQTQTPSKSRQTVPQLRIRKMSRRRLKRVARLLWPFVLLNAVTLAVFACVLVNGVVTVPVEKDKAVWMLLPWQAMVTAIGGLIALREYNRSHQLKRAEFTQKEKQFAADQHTKQIQFEEKTQEDRFNDIQDRFADADDKTRANAALRLAEVAQLPRPGFEGKPVCAENNPFYLRAAAPLAIALHMEENDSVRAAVKEALQTLVTFVKDKEPEDPLLHQLIRKLHDANITAKRAFIKTLAEYRNSVPNKSETVLIELLCDVAHFTSDNATNSSVLLSLMETDDFKSDCRIHQQTHGLSSEEIAKTAGTLLAKVQLTAARLVDTRDALAESLRALSALTDSHARRNRLDLKFVFLTGANLAGAILQEADLQGAILQEAILRGANLWEADLQEAILRGANLWEADLWGANLREADLQNSNLWEAKLREANLREANLREADLREADLREANLWKADLWGANLQNSNLWKADLWGANLQSADLREANLWEADLRGANLWEADLRGANLQGAKLQGANLREAKLQGAMLFHTEVSIFGSEYKADFTSTSWWAAHFQVGAEFDAELVRWLNEHFPPPAAVREIEKFKRMLQRAHEQTEGNSRKS